mmetsp:Transcript_6458/g.8904  ORF Transcript_6458/g.8904 Transcript_6458/m.8904 type:complete len:90 (-) Transcript_6458:356-625(-)
MYLIANHIEVSMHDMTAATCFRKKNIPITQAMTITETMKPTKSQVDIGYPMNPWDDPPEAIELGSMLLEAPACVESDALLKDNDASSEY